MTSGRSSRQDRELAASERRDAEAAQARTIVIGGVVGETIRERPGEELVLRRVSGWLGNFGSEPVTDVVFVISRVGIPGDPVDLTTEDYASVLAPNDRVELDWELPDDRLPSERRIHLPASYLRDEGEEGLVLAEARFTDVAGRRRIRISNARTQRFFD